jgi:glycosidase
MGVDILWLMPIQPPGVKNRKGSYGSPYSLRDYFSVNPDYGTLDEFKDLVDEVHGLGMHILIDWVANHTGWDHPWVDEHPEWYKKNGNGEICSYEYDNGREIEH